MPSTPSAAPTSTRARWQTLLERLAPFLAVFGLTASLIPDYLGMSRLGYPGIDFKVVYVSTWLFAHGQDPYNLALAPAVYAAQGLAAPDTMFGHAPVYPPFTYAILCPLSLLHGPAAVSLELLLSALLMSVAVASLVRYSSRELHLSFPWRLALIAVCGACPLLAFGLQIGNLSVAASALCILAITEGNRRPRLAALTLATALLLKPHLAFWFLLAIAAGSGKPGRRLAALTAGLVTAFCAAVALIFTAQHRLFSILPSFAALLHSEQAAGSMSPQSREVLPLAAQITGFSTIPGFFVASRTLSAVLYVIAIAALATLLGRTAWRARGDLLNPEAKLLFTAAVVAFGLTATYHRAHDAMALLLLAPVILLRLKGSWRSPSTWALVLGCFTLCIGLGAPTGVAEHQSAREFLLLRQAALSILFIAGILAWQGAKKGGTNGDLSVPGGQ